MRSAALAVSLVLVALLGVTRAARVNEIEAKQFAEHVSKKLFEYYDTIADKSFSMNEGDFNSSFYNRWTIRSMQEQIIIMVNDARQFDFAQFKDPEMRRVFRTISKSAGWFLGGEYFFRQMSKSVNTLKKRENAKQIRPYRKQTEEFAYFPDVHNVIEKSNDPAELKYYVKSWRERLYFWYETYFYNLVQSMKITANLTDVPVLELWSEFYNIEEMEVVMSQIKPLYTQLHSFIRNQLFKKYGEMEIQPNGPIPDHLFQQVLVQAWSNGSVIEDMFPHKDLPPYDDLLKEKDYDANKMFESANEFYISLGFTPVPDAYWGDRLKMDTKEDIGDCEANIYDITSNVRMNYCHKMDFRTFLQAHGYMGRIYYALEKKNLPFYYFKSYDLEYPVGQAVILSASTPKHLKAVGLAQNFRFTDDVLMNRHLRMGIHTLLNIPLYFVESKVMFDLLTEKVDRESVNKHYWKLMEEFAGVEPAIDRDQFYFDFPVNFCKSPLENTQTKKVVSEVLGYQFYRKLCQISGQYPATPLNDCDFYGSKEAGDTLKQMMAMGSSKPWRVVLGNLLPENNKLNADALLEYYQPIMDWLTAKNRVDNQKIGWNPSSREVV